MPQKGVSHWIFLCVLPLVLAAFTGRADSASGFLAYRNADWADSGVGVGAKYTWELPSDFRVDARFSFVHFGDPDLDMVPLETTASYQWTDHEWEPYAGLGVGYYFLDGNRGDADGDIGFQLFAGFEMDVGLIWDLFAEINWLFLESDVDSTFQEVERTDSTIDLDGIGINLGLVYRF